MQINQQHRFLSPNPYTRFLPFLVLQGRMVSENHFADVIIESFGVNMKRMIEWIAKCLLHAKTETELMENK